MSTTVQPTATLRLPHLAPPAYGCSQHLSSHLRADGQRVTLVALGEGALRRPALYVVAIFPDVGPTTGMVRREFPWSAAGLTAARGAFNAATTVQS